MPIQPAAIRVCKKKKAALSTPPPLQSRVNLQNDEPCSKEKPDDHSHDYIPIVSSDVIKQLMAVREQLSPAGDLCRDKVMSTEAKSKFWRKSRAKKVATVRHASEEGIFSNFNTKVIQAISGKPHKVRKNTTVTPVRMKLSTSPHSLKSASAVAEVRPLEMEGKTTDSPSRSAVDRIWQKHDDIKSEDYQENVQEKHSPIVRRCQPTRRDATKRRRYSLPPFINSKLVNRKSDAENYALQKVLDDPHNLGNILSVKHFTLLFRAHLQSEFSEENLDFWLECETYKQASSVQQKKMAPKMFAEYLTTTATREVNVDEKIRKDIEKGLENPDGKIFDAAQLHVYKLMSKDSHRRFLNSEIFQELKNTICRSQSVKKSLIPFMV